MIYLKKTPTPPLSSWIRTLWYCRAPHIPHRRERVLPNGCMQIILNLSREYLTDCGTEGTANGRLSRAIVVGARARYEVVDTTDMDELVGILFQPAGFTGLFHERADLFFERFVALDDVWAGSNIIERLSEIRTPAGKLQTLEELLTPFAHRGTRCSELVKQAVHLFQSQGLNVAECGRSTGISGRWLSQVFREELGMSPKLWYRVWRFQAAVRALHCGTDVPWAELALQCGYYDQSHFANDFRAFSGINPSLYSSSRGRWQNHVPIR